jgi:hypothetical protein
MPADQKKPDISAVLASVKTSEVKLNKTKTSGNSSGLSSRNQVLGAIKNKKNAGSLTQTPIKSHSSSISGRNKLMGSIKKGHRLSDAAQKLQRAEEQTRRATAQAYKAAKKEQKEAKNK